MIQLNLLPDIKLQYIKSKRSKRMVMVFSVLAIGISVALLVIMLSLTLLQKKHITELNKDIKSTEKQLKDTPDLAKILTIQNQLSSLPGLYSQRPVTSRLFQYMEQTTPSNAKITHLLLDFTEGTLTIDGKSDTLESVNRYADTLKFTTFKVKDSDEERKAFSEVVLAEFGRDAVAASFSLKMKFDTDIFNGENTVALSVPATISTRSKTELPSNGLFEDVPAATTETGQ